VTSLVDWAAAVVSAPPHIVLPIRPRAAIVDVPGPLVLLNAFELGDENALLVVADDGGQRWVVPSVSNDRGLARAIPGDGTAAAFVGALSRPREGDRFRLRSWHMESLRDERPIPVDQTNESVVVGERAVVKWHVRLPSDSEPVNPAADRMSCLANADFPYSPRPWGFLEWHDGDRWLLVASVVDYLPDAVDGWEWLVSDVASAATGVAPMSTAVAPVREVGRIVALLHATLASGGADEVGPDAVQQWRLACESDLADALLLLDGMELERLRDRAEQIQAFFDSLNDIPSAVVIDTHADLHIGQVLRYGTPPNYAITDFDGNPVQGVSPTTLRQPAAADVAGMLASLDHVGRVVLRHTPSVDAQSVRWWLEQAQDAFLSEYRVTLAGAGCSNLLDERLLAPFRLRQECKEFIYAVKFLPHWRYVADEALRDLLPDKE